MMKTLTVAEAADLVQQRKVALAAAEQKVATALEATEAQSDSGALARCQKELRAAQNDRDDAKAALAMAERKHQAAIKGEAERLLAAQWQHARSLGGELLGEVETLKLQLQAVAEQFVKVNRLREQLAIATPWKPATVELSSPLWSAPAFANLTQMQLYMESDGALLAGRFAMSAWELRQGPDLCARFRENITRALSHAPRAASTSDLPPAA